ncbi:M14 family metallopeptidase [Lederbergia sp. NSJ-179]|uniref:M14 family metallopeptidase n=1 Tax=Lederbergia sp. NSJ-179 TaxID=2931402 RepID=UPI001FD151A6|nr:M14 family metallopeptidase [Lederbergia sp. NSJ-179]MCJ7842242.1 M14 family metallopeptidase [Lederbergia sp. NSJ-179]
MKIQVRAGDTLEYYSRLFSIPLVLIADANPGIDPEQLQIDETVHIPGFRENTYTIRYGDTLSGIAKSYQLKLDTLFLLNQEVDPNNLSVGDELFIPIRMSKRVVDPKAHYDFTRLKADIEALAELYPFIQKREAGRSVLHQPLYDLRIGKGQRKVQINASFHANEWITTCVLMTFLNDYLIMLTNGQKISQTPALSLYEQAALSAIPMVNPDGVNLVRNGPPKELEKELITLNNGSADFSGWKANIRGIDLNKQFPANWEFEKKRKPKKPGPRDFLGFKPISEPETMAMAELVQKERFARLLSLHTQGQEIYWGYEGLEPLESKRLAHDFAKLSGYEAVQYVDSFVGYKDWFIQEFRKPGFTIELGIGQNPLPISQFDEIYTDIQPLLVRALES